MGIAQVLPPRPTEYQKKSQRIDFQLLEGVITADVTLVYGRPPVSELPEAVELAYFNVDAGFGPQRRPEGRVQIGSYRRKSIVPLVERTMHRLHRTRDDIEWLLLDGPPTDFSPFDVWIDPAAHEDDLDGFVAEAQVSGKIVVATRTSINVKRLEKGRTGFLVPPGDPNELSHAILAALFKPEVSQQKIEAAKQTISKYHPRHRLRALQQLLK